MGEMPVFVMLVAFASVAGLSTFGFYAGHSGTYFEFAVLIEIVGFPLLQSYSHFADVRLLEIEEIERAYESLGMKPDNPLAIFRLARAFATKREFEYAYSLGTKAVRGLPKERFPNEHQEIFLWERSLHREVSTQVKCERCGFLNDPTNPFCQGCGDRYLLYMVDHRPLKNPGTSRMIVAWLVLVGIGLMIPAIGAIVPPPANGIVVILFVIASVGGIWAMVLKKAS